MDGTPEALPLSYDSQDSHRKALRLVVFILYAAGKVFFLFYLRLCCSEVLKFLFVYGILF